MVRLLWRGQKLRGQPSNASREGDSQWVRLHDGSGFVLTELGASGGRPPTPLFGRVMPPGGDRRGVSLARSTGSKGAGSCGRKLPRWLPTPLSEQPWRSSPDRMGMGGSYVIPLSVVADTVIQWFHDNPAAFE